MSSCLAFKKSLGLKSLDISIEYVFWQVLQLDVVQTPVSK